MTGPIIVTLCILLLIAYIFDLTSARTKIPSVILLLLLGWIVHQISVLLRIQIPDLTPLLPILGTVGLILIVLEGALELELDKSKTSLIKRSFIVSFVPIIAIAFFVGYIFHVVGHLSFKNCLTNIIPFCVISSAIAIPTVKNLAAGTREFVIYESSFSDILGVIFFNFVAFNTSFGFHSFAIFGLQLIIVTIISFIATVGLSVLLNKIDHHIKFAPIVLLVILIYEVSKEYNLPALIFILSFGIFLGNLNELDQFKWIQKLHPNQLSKEVHKFKELITEATFLTRALFFLLFGYLIETREILNTNTLVWAIGIVATIFLIRALILWLVKMPIKPLLFIAPRGLITILLFLSIPAAEKIPLVNKSLVIQVIVLTVLVMMIGMMSVKKKQGTIVSMEENPAII
ncbi:MAG TPA: cation:proton antiporter [Ferruginibacter sp.]|nr:cation:proton antiporter [Ferruginibacter sp.]